MEWSVARSETEKPSDTTFSLFRFLPTHIPLSFMCTSCARTHTPTRAHVVTHTAQHEAIAALLAYVADVAEAEPAGRHAWHAVFVVHVAPRVRH